MEELEILKQEAINASIDEMPQELTKMTLIY